MRKKINKAISLNLSLPKKKKCSFQRLAYPISLVIISSLFFLLLEFKYPYFFLHDDNRTYWLPSFVYNYRSIQKGEIPLFNFHQFLGYPWHSNGQTAVLYPFGYIAPLISKIFFDHYFATVDIYIILHLIAGALTFYILLKYIGLNEKSSFFGAITWVLCGFNIFASTGWSFLSNYVAYFPLLIYFSLKLCNNFSYKTFVYLIICRVLLFMVGHSQYFAYAVIFEIFTFLLVLVFSKFKQEKEQLFRSLKIYLYSYVFTTILSLPLLLPMWHQMNISAGRSDKLRFVEFASFTYDITQWIRGLIYPFTQKNDWGFLYVLSYSSYIGYFTIIFIIICLFNYFKGNYSKNKRILISVFLSAALVAFLWMTSSLFNHIIYLIPILNRFRMPFKIEFFVNFYLIIIASIGFSFLINKISTKTLKNIIFIILIAEHIFSFCYLYMFTPRRTFQEYHAKVPFEEPFKEKINNGRIIGFDSYYAINMLEPSDFIGSNFATLWGLYHFAGYELLISKDNLKACLNLNGDAIMYLYKGLWENNKINERINYFRQWGVKWYIVNKETILQVKLPFKKVFEDEKRNIYYDEKAKPFFFWQDNQNDHGISYSIKTNEIRLNLNNDKAQDLVINFLYNTFFKASLDNKDINIRSNSFKQMVISVPEGKHNVVIKYRDPYFTVSCYVVLLFLLTVVVIYFVKKLKLKNFIEINNCEAINISKINKI